MRVLTLDLHDAILSYIIGNPCKPVSVLNWVKTWGYRDRWEMALVFKEIRVSQKRIIAIDNCSDYDKSYGGSPHQGMSGLKTGSSFFRGFKVGFPWEVANN